MQPQTPHRPLGEILIEQGVIDEAGLAKALAYRREKGVKLGQALVELEITTESAISDALRRQGKVQWIHLSPAILNVGLANELEEDQARDFGAVVVNRIAGITTVALEDPTDLPTLDEISRLLRTRVFAVHADPEEIRRCQDSVYASNSEPTVEIKDITEDEDLENEEVSGEQVVRIVQNSIEQAFATGASDIHYETRREDFVVRYRIDGGLVTKLTLPRSWSRSLIARIKVMANMDIAQRRLPQDGRAQMEMGGSRVDLRIATSPCLYGEVAVIRILDGGRKLRNLDGLGFDERQLADLRRMISNKDGFAVATGPTGSGKTTTLYALLQEVNTPDKKIITLEDPVENHLEGGTQINADARSGMTFARGLRSILRQDPDVVLVGEIRDQETAHIAIEASMTGHLVLSTLHTLGTAETILRLMDLEVEPFILADALRGVVAQRLIRRVCEQCSEVVRPQEMHADLLKKTKLVTEDFSYRKGAGCEYCSGTGYRGRVALYEVMSVNRELGDVIRRSGKTGEIREVMRAHGVMTLAEDALRKCKQGLTTIEEIVPVLIQVL
ncbi:MAG: ATPase, T2SS/T4P/T4SS family [Planctomycetota bacterium]